MILLTVETFVVIWNSMHTYLVLHNKSYLKGQISQNIPYFFE